MHIRFSDRIDECKFENRINLFKYSSYAQLKLKQIQTIEKFFIKLKNKICANRAFLIVENNQ